MLTIRSEQLFRPSHLDAQTRSGRPSRPSLLRHFGHSIWRGLEQVGQARARRHLRQLADMYEHCSPSFAAELRAASRFDASSPALVGSYRTVDAAAPATSPVAAPQGS